MELRNEGGKQLELSLRGGSEVQLGFALDPPAKESDSSKEVQLQSDTWLSYVACVASGRYPLHKR